MNQRRRFLQVLGSGVVAAGVGCDAPVGLEFGKGTGGAGGKDPGAGVGGGTGGAGGSSTVAIASSASSASSTAASSRGGDCGTGGAASQGMNSDTCHSARGRYDVGLASNYAADGIHKVSNTSANVLVVRDAGGLYALSSLCTHLCCDMNGSLGAITTVGGKPGLRCLCHNSKYLADGSVAAGPATTALAAHPLSVGCDGKLYVDTAMTVPSSQRLVA